jgi:hypothetical protein
MPLDEQIKTYFFGTTEELKKKVHQPVGELLYSLESISLTTLFFNPPDELSLTSALIFTLGIDSLTRLSNLAAKYLNGYQFDKKVVQIPGIIGIYKEYRELFTSTSYNPSKLEQQEQYLESGT